MLKPSLHIFAIEKARLEDPDDSQVGPLQRVVSSQVRVFRWDELRSHELLLRDIDQHVDIKWTVASILKLFRVRFCFEGFECIAIRCVLSVGTGLSIVLLGDRIGSNAVGVRGLRVARLVEAVGLKIVVFLTMVTVVGCGFEFAVLLFLWGELSCFRRLLRRIYLVWVDSIFMVRYSDSLVNGILLPFVSSRLNRIVVVLVLVNVVKLLSLFPFVYYSYVVPPL